MPTCDKLYFSCYTILCYFIFIVELANSLNDPEGFLIQARNGINISSEIIGTFLDPVVVRDILTVGDTAPQVNYKILSCNRSIFDTDSQPVSSLSWL